MDMIICIQRVDIKRAPFDLHGIQFIFSNNGHLQFIYYIRQRYNNIFFTIKENTKDVPRKKN